MRSRLLPLFPPLPLFPLALLSCSSEKPPPDWRRVPVTIELSLAQAAAGAGLVPATVYGQNKKVYLSPGSGLSSQEIARVEATKTMTGSGLVLDVWLTASGAKRLVELTSKHFGENLAVLIDSTVVTVPPIRDTVNVGTKLPFSIGVPLGRQDADRLASAIAKTWRARR
jgi:preprotein translocase subunit SecD